MVLLVKILCGNGGLCSTKQGVGQTFVLPQRQFWVPESSLNNPRVKLFGGLALTRIAKEGTLASKMEAAF